jgi:hypothetical protein
LQVGGVVVVRNRSVVQGRSLGYQRYTVVDISPKRTKFSVRSNENQGILEFNRNGVRKTGGGVFDRSMELAPLTKDIETSIARDDTYIEARRLMYRFMYRLREYIDKDWLETASAEKCAATVKTLQLTLATLDALAKETK